MLLVVEEHVAAPVAGHVERAGEDRGQPVVESAVFRLGVSAFLCHIALVVAVDHIADTELLEFPVGIERGRVVVGLHILSGLVVHIIFTLVEVHDLVVVVADIVADVDTAGECELFGNELVFVGRDKSVPLVVVVGCRHHHVRSCLRSHVHALDRGIVECAVGAAEQSVELALARAVPA